MCHISRPLSGMTADTISLHAGPSRPALAPLTISPVTHGSPGKLGGRASPSHLSRSPVSETFRRAAASQDVLVAEPRARPKSAMPGEQGGDAGAGAPADTIAA